MRADLTVKQQELIAEFERRLTRAEQKMVTLERLGNPVWSEFEMLVYQAEDLFDEGVLEQ